MFLHPPTHPPPPKKSLDLLWNGSLWLGFPRYPKLDLITSNSLLSSEKDVNTNGNECEKTSDEEQEQACRDSPLSNFRNNYLWVSDLVQQIWCEQQMVYKMTLPTVHVEDPAMTLGSTLHLARGMLYVLC